MSGHFQIVPPELQFLEASLALEWNGRKYKSWEEVSDSFYVLYLDRTYIVTGDILVHCADAFSGTAISRLEDSFSNFLANNWRKSARIYWIDLDEDDAEEKAMEISETHKKMGYGVEITAKFLEAELKKLCSDDKMDLIIASLAMSYEETPDVSGDFIVLSTPSSTPSSEYYHVFSKPDLEKMANDILIHKHFFQGMKHPAEWLEEIGRDKVYDRLSDLIVCKCPRDPEMVNSSFGEKINEALIKRFDEDGKTPPAF